MASEFERPRITEINVRMDCNGCVQKVKKALNGIHGIYDLHIDVPQQKLKVIGRADPEKIMKAIKKVRKVATLCSHEEVPDPNSQPPEPAQDGGAPPPPEGQETGPAQLSEPPRSEEAPLAPQEPPTDQPSPPQPHENPPAQGPPPESNHPTEPADMQSNQPSHSSNVNDTEEVHVIHNNPHEYGRRYDYGYGYGSRPSFRDDPSYQRVYHEPSRDSGYYERPTPTYQESAHESGYHEQHRPGYNDLQSRPGYHDPQTRPGYYEPPPRVHYHELPQRESYLEPPPPRARYYEPPPPRARYYEPSPPRVRYHEPPPSNYHEQLPQQVYATQSYNMYRPAPSVTQYHYARSPPRYTPHNRTNYYDMDSYQYGDNSNGNVTSIFSDENPNACTIV